MAKRNIVTEGDPVLRSQCRPVEKITPRVLTLLDDMVQTMRAADGVGLAAPQVGILRRIVVIEVEPGQVYELINPEIVETSGEQEGPEGCLSLPGRSGCVRRPMNATVRALDRNGNTITVSGTGLLARAICHETDHLDGVLYTDRALYMYESAAPDRDDDKYEKEKRLRKFRKR